ncbi:uncharacterized protein KY384_003961 [Bacidia gigantensis]|uniref:uncharacterized protein n=1 Tax=Bacidia gigantensis TaxID=2732470 RepID=UPI001D03A537|nr:uncharacterized protein KY384_003961 [Bacidia gigantensis]KAG8532320.1 hypothetical protein KY384_003961 [Bacidia gigantensis]
MQTGYLIALAQLIVIIKTFDARPEMSGFELCQAKGCLNIAAGPFEVKEPNIPTVEVVFCESHLAKAQDVRRERRERNRATKTVRRIKRYEEQSSPLNEIIEDSERHCCCHMDPASGYCPQVFDTEENLEKHRMESGHPKGTSKVMEEWLKSKQGRTVSSPGGAQSTIDLEVSEAFMRDPVNYKGEIDSDHWNEIFQDDVQPDLEFDVKSQGRGVEGNRRAVDGIGGGRALLPSEIDLLL